jgi:hypothetical protein
MEIKEKVFIGQHYVSKSGVISPVTVLECAFGLVLLEEDVNGREFWLSKKELLQRYDED